MIRFIALLDRGRSMAEGLAGTIATVGVVGAGDSIGVSIVVTGENLASSCS